MKKQISAIWGLTLIGLLSITMTNAQIAGNPPYRLEQSVVASGGGASRDVSDSIYKIEGTIGQFAAGTTGTNSPFTLRSGFFTPESLAPTAAAVAIEGRVRMENGTGIRNVIITLTEADGTLRTVSSGTFGNFRFIDITVGQVIVLSVSAKKFSFSQSTLVLNVTEEVTGLEFIAFER